jgi:hypothetical protein
MGKVFGAIADGVITPAEGESLMNVLVAQKDTLVKADLDVHAAFFSSLRSNSSMRRSSEPVERLSGRLPLLCKPVPVHRLVFALQIRILLGTVVSRSPLFHLFFTGPVNMANRRLDFHAAISKAAKSVRAAPWIHRAPAGSPVFHLFFTGIGEGLHLPRMTEATGGSARRSLIRRE